MTESELYRSLGELTKSKARWKENIPYVASRLASEYYLLFLKAKSRFCGRIGRGRFESIEPYWTDLFRFARDEAVGVRLAFIWASENIATNTPDPYRDRIVRIHCQGAIKAATG